MADGIFTVVKSVDPRMTQGEHSFCATQGASAMSVTSIQAPSPSTAVLSFSIVPPSPQVVIQKTPLLDITATFALVFNQSNGFPAAGAVGNLNNGVYMNPWYVPFAQWGRDFALARAAPLGQLVNSYNIQINNAAVQQQNTSLPDLVHVLEGPRGRASRGTTFRTPVFASWDDAAGTAWGLGSLADMQGDGDMPPGGFDFVYCDPAGGPLFVTGQVDIPPANWPVDGAGNPIPPGYPYIAGNVNVVPPDGRYTQCYISGGVCVPFYQGQPLTCAGWSSVAPAAGPPVVVGANSYYPFAAGAVGAPDTGGNISRQVPIFIKMRLIDVIMCSPFGFSVMDSFRETGLYGISSMLINAQLTTAANARLFQNCTTSGCVMVPGDGGQTLKQISDARVWMTYLSPSIQSDLPPQSIASLCNIQFFTQPTPPTLAVNGWSPGQPLTSLTIPFNSVTFSNVPDVFLISVRPTGSNSLPNEGDYCAIFPDQAIQQFTFANMSGLFSNYTAERLAAISRNNGVKAGLQQFGGATGTGYAYSGGKRTIVGGAPLCIRPGMDFPLPTGVSVGSTGQCQLNFTLSVLVPPGTTSGRQFTCYVTALSSAYFVTDNGVSRQVLVGLDEAAVLSAPSGPDRYMTQRLVGGGWMSGLASFAKNAWQNKDKLMDAGQQAYSAYKNGDPMGALGAAHSAYQGMTGQGMAGGGLAGAALAGMKRARLGGMPLAAQLAR